MISVCEYDRERERERERDGSLSGGAGPAWLMGGAGAAGCDG